MSKYSPRELGKMMSENKNKALVKLPGGELAEQKRRKSPVIKSMTKDILEKAFLEFYPQLQSFTASHEARWN